MNVNLDISILLGLLGGLALFLYGMQMMSAGLEAAAGNRMKGILERLTSNRFLGILWARALPRSSSPPPPPLSWWWASSTPA